MAVPPAPVWVPSQRLLAPSATSVANDKGDNEIPGAGHLPYGCGKPQLGDRLMKGLCDQSFASNGVPFLQMRSVGSNSTSEKEEV